MYLRILSLPVKSTYETLAGRGEVDRLPGHKPFVGIYAKLNPTIFAPNEYETDQQFQSAFQQLFNIYCVESLVTSILDACKFGHCQLTEEDESSLLRGISDSVLAPNCYPPNLPTLLTETRKVRRQARQAIDSLPLASDLRSQPDLLWQVAEIVSSLTPFESQRVHFLIDEYDSLSQQQQRIVNTYLRKRDFPVTFKLACKKHCLTLEDVFDKPLNPSGDFHRVELDDNDFGISSTYTDYVIAIANKRFKNEGYETTVQALLGPNGRKTKRGAEIQYSGIKTVTMLSSGIVRTFLELCRDIFSKCEVVNGEPTQATMSLQNTVIKKHAANKWSSLSRDHSARAELQHLVEQIATIFKLKGESSKEKKIIRLEIIDYNRMTSFLRTLLNQALEYEALVQPNRERLQKNRKAASRGYLLHRLLCVHFRLEPTSRWDAEITSDQLERLVLGDYETAVSVARNPTKKDSVDMNSSQKMSQLFRETNCPIMEEKCPAEMASQGLGFLSCRLPKGGHIRDAIRMLKDAFSVTSGESVQYQLKTAEDYPAQGDIACKVCNALANSQFVLVELSRQSPSVAMELGLAIARQKPTYILFNSDEQSSVPEPFSSLEYFKYQITPDGVRELVEARLLSQISSNAGGRTIRLGPERPPLRDQGKGVFVALPGDNYHQNTILPALKARLQKAGLLPVMTEQEGQALQDLQRAATNIANAKYCLIDTTNGATTRAMYLGLAQGYRKTFVNLIDEQCDPDTRVFTNAKSKSEIDYSDSEDLIQKLVPFFRKFGVSL